MKAGIQENTTVMSFVLSGGRMSYSSYSPMLALCLYGRQLIQNNKTCAKKQGRQRSAAMQAASGQCWLHAMTVIYS